MKKTLPIVLLVLVLCLSVGFAACKKTETVTLDSIKVEKQPTKLSYNAGEKFDPTGIKVVANYSDGTTKDVTDKCTYSPYGALNANNNKITVKYSEEINGEKVSKSAEISIRVTAAPVEDKPEQFVDLVDVKPSDMPHVLVTNSDAAMVFYTYYDCGSMKIEGALELTPDAADANKGTFVYTEMAGHTDRTYKLGVINGTYAIDGDKMNFVAKQIHTMPKLSNPSETNSGKLTGATTEQATIAKDDSGNIVGLNFGRAVGGDKTWGWSKSNASDFIESLATQHGLTAEYVYMEKVVGKQLSANQKAYYVVNTVGLYQDGDISYGMPEGNIYAGDKLELPSDMFIGVNYVVPDGSTERNLLNQPVDHDFTLEIKRGDEKLAVDVELQVGDKLLITYDGVEGEVELNVQAAPETPVLRKITTTAPFKSIYKLGEKIDLTGMTVTAHYTTGGADKEVALADCKVEVVGSEVAFAEYTMSAPVVTLKISYTDGAVTAIAHIQVSASVLPWNVVLQGNADFSYINYSRRKQDNAQEAFSAIQLFGDATKGTYYVTVLVTKDKWTTEAKSADYYVYTGSYNVSDGFITLANPTNMWLKNAEGKMFYNPAVSEQEIKDFVEGNNVKGAVTVDEKGIITSIAFEKTTLSNNRNDFFGFQNKDAYPMNFELVGSELPETVKKYIPAEIYTNQQAVTKRLVGMIVVSAPSKLAYTEGEKFSLEGLKIVAYYNDGTTVEVTNLSVADKVLATTDEKVTVTATIEGNTPYTFEFAITVKSAQATFERTEVGGNYKTEYAAGEKFDVTNLVVEAVYSDGSKQPITDYTIVNGDQALSKGTTSVTIRYMLNDEEKTAEIAITVGDAKLVSIAISGEYKTSYTEGDKFDPTGLVVTATYTDGDRDVTEDAVVNGDQALAFGASKVTVSYGGMTADIDISVAMTAPWLRAEKSTAQYVFAANILKHQKGSDVQYSWTSIELFANNTFRTTSVFMVTKHFVHTGTYTIEGDTVTFTIGENGFAANSNSSAFESAGSFVATLVKTGDVVTGLKFAYTGDNDKVFGINSANGEITMGLVTGGKLSWELLSAIPETLRYVAELQVEGEPKKNYTEGEIFDKGEMKVFAVYNDGARYDVTEHATYPTGNMSIDMTTVTIGFGGQTKTIDGIVVEQAATPALNGIELSGEYKTAYRIGEKIDLAGLVVTAKYTAGKADEVVTDYTVTIKDSESTVADTYLTGNVTLVVTYGEFSKEIAITADWADPRTLATTSTADYVFAGYVYKQKGQEALYAVELNGELNEKGGTYYIAIDFAKTSNGKTTHPHIAYAGTYTVTNDQIKFAIPAFVCREVDTVTGFYYEVEGNANMTTAKKNGYFGANLIKDGDTVTGFEFVYTKNVTTESAFMFAYGKDQSAVKGKVFYLVTNNVIPTALENTLKGTAFEKAAE